MVSKIISSKEQEYEGYRIIDEALTNKMSKAELIAALKVMWVLVMEADKTSRDNEYLFGKGLLQFNKAMSNGDKVKDMTKEQQDKLKVKITNVKPLVDFLLKMKDVIS